MIIALNNKSNLSKAEFKTYLNELNNINSNHKLILCPTYLNIGEFTSNNISLGSQNVSSTNDGPYTGEVSAKQLKSYNVEYSLVGHSERRKNQKETEEEIFEKIIRLLENNIIPILCIGETKEERDNNKVYEIIDKSLENVKRINNEFQSKIIIAYEPVWSIGTGIIPTTEEINEVITYIKKEFPNNKVLYGGSANEKNIDILKQITTIDGYLLGGLSLKPNQLKEFIDKLN